MNSCDCSGSNVINNLLQNPNNNLSSMNNLGGLDSMNGMNNMGMLGMNNSNNAMNLSNYGNVGNNVNVQGQGVAQPRIQITQQPNNNGRSTNINQLRATIDNNSNRAVNNVNNAVNNTNNTNNTNNNSHLINRVGANMANNVANIAQSTYSYTFMFLGVGIMITAASAWHEAVKFFINRSIRLNQGAPTYYLYYALILTVLAAFFFNITKKYVDKNVKGPLNIL